MLPDDILPTMIIACTLAIVVLAHTQFYRLASRFSAQMPLNLSNGPLASPFIVLDRRAENAVPEMADATGFDTAAGELRQDVGASHGAAPEVHGSDLRLKDRHSIQVPFKVCGDLEITGDAVFDKVVVVDGLLVIDGSARFLGGLVVKNRMIVNGQAVVGSSGRESWAVTRRIAGRGRLTVWQQNHQLLQLAAS